MYIYSWQGLLNYFSRSLTRRDNSPIKINKPTRLICEVLEIRCNPRPFIFISTGNLKVHCKLDAYPLGNATFAPRAYVNVDAFSHQCAQIVTIFWIVHTAFFGRHCIDSQVNWKVSMVNILYIFFISRLLTHESWTLPVWKEVRRSLRPGN